MDERPLRLLVLANGHGEDLLARTLVAALQNRARARREALEVWAFPMVGEGRSWSAPGAGTGASPAADLQEEGPGKLPWKLVGVQAAMPSGGFLLEGSGGLWEDLRAGLTRLLARQARSVRRLGRQVDWVLAVGDVVPLAAATLIAGRPTVFVSTAKSVRIRGFGRAERRLMRRARLVFARDPESARELAGSGVPARYAGNLMMDALETGSLPQEATQGLVVGLVPGSHVDAYENLTVMGRVSTSVASRWPGATRFLVPLASSLELARAAEAVRAGGWRPSRSSPAPEAGGLWFVPDPSVTAETRLWVASGLFGAILRACHLVVGLAGTANEQAVGLGKPVVAFPGPGFQATGGFLDDQRRLLGEALSVTSPHPDEVAREVCRIASDPARYRRMSEAGKAAMGRAGAAERMAAQILDALSGGEGPFRLAVRPPRGEDRL